MRKAMHLVDPDTGEVMGTLSPGDRIVRKESVAAFTRMKAAERQKLEREDMRKMKYAPGYLTVNTAELQKILEEKLLTQYELGMLGVVENFARRTSCEIENRDGEIATVDDIADMCGLSRGRTHDILKGLVSKGMLAKARRGHRMAYIMNPWISVKDMYVLKSLKDLFGEYEIRTHGGKKWKEITD